MSAERTGLFVADPAAVVVDVTLPMGGGGGPHGVEAGTVTVGGVGVSLVPLNFVSHSPFWSADPLAPPPTVS